MKRSLCCSILALVSLAACQDTTRSPSEPRLGPKASANEAVLEQYAIRADQEYAASSDELNTALADIGQPDFSIAQAGTTECVGLLIGAFEKVEVPAGATCNLVNSTVQLWAKANAGSRFFIFNSQIGGNLMGLGANAVQLLSNSRVFGSMHVDNGGDPVFASAAIAFNSRVDGNVHIMNHHFGAPRLLQVVTVGGSVDIVGNFIPPGFILQMQQTNAGGSAHVSNNTGSANTKIVNNNTIAKVLVCQNNDPPFIGGPNAAGNAKGQCF